MCAPSGGGHELTIAAWDSPARAVTAVLRDQSRSALSTARAICSRVRVTGRRRPTRGSAQWRDPPPPASSRPSLPASALADGVLAVVLRHRGSLLRTRRHAPSPLHEVT